MAKYERSTIRPRLQELLDQLHKAGNIPRNRRGQISREKLAELLGVASTSLTQHLDIIQAVEEKVGLLHPINAALPNVKAHALELISKGQLRLRDNKADRAQVSQPVGRSLTTNMSRYPQIGEFFDWLDRHIVEIGYKPADIAEGLERLEAYLACERALCRDGMTYDCVQIGSAVGISSDRLRTEPYLSLIRAAEENYVTQLRAEGTSAFCHGRIFKFEPLILAGWSRRATQRFTATFRVCFEGRPKGVAEDGFLAVKAFLLWLATSASNPAHSCFRSLNSSPSVHPDPDAWVEMLLDFQGSINDSGQRRQMLTLVQNYINASVTEGLMPPMPASFRYRGKRKEGRYATIAEALRHDQPIRRTQEQHVDDYLLFATDMLAQAGKVRGVQIDVEEQSAFVQTLRDELVGRTSSPDDNPMKVIRTILHERVELIANAAHSIFLEKKAHFESGQDLLELGEDCGEAWDELVQRTSGNYRHAQLLDRWFPSRNPNQAKANLLRVVRDRYGGVVPTEKNSSVRERRFFLKRVGCLQGATEFQSCLWPSPDAFAAALTMFLCKTGSNVAVGRTMPTGYLEPSQEPGYLIVKSNKDKARGKAIISDIEGSSPTAQSILWLDTIRRETNIRVDEADSGYLFVTRGKSQFKVMSGDWYLVWFKRLVASIKQIAHLRITPVMIRPTILLLTALESDGGVRVSAAVGQHGEHVNQRYSGRYPLLFLHDSEMILFNRFFEAVSLQSIESAHIILGISAEEFAERVETFARTGLGTFCGDPGERARPGESHCQSLDCWNDCPQLIIFPLPKEIALLLLWQRTLRSVEGDWVRDRPERWEGVWLPWLCFVDAVEARMKLNYRKIWRDAQEYAEELSASPHFIPPQPW